MYENYCPALTSPNFDESPQGLLYLIRA
jgi:hypothetical protein